MAMTLEEKISKAEATAKERAEKEGLDEAATKAFIDEAVRKVKGADAKAHAKATEKLVQLIVTVDSNPTYCGVGAGGVQFANGKAVGVSDRMAQWFAEHEGYTVTEE